MESGASLMWERKEMGLAQEPSAQADVELTEMGRSQQRAGGGEGPVGATNQELVVGRIRTWLQMGYSGETNMVQWQEEVRRYWTGRGVERWESLP